MFKFNFNIDSANEEEANIDNKETEEKNYNVESSTKLNWISPKKVIASSVKPDLLRESNTIITCKDGTKIKYINPSIIERELENSESENMKLAINNHTDLIPAVYEGGLKIWECTWDLIEFLSDSKLDFNNKRVLELGCGGGLPAIYAALKGAFVAFQDYNEEVIRNWTIPNALLNLVPLEYESCTESSIETSIKESLPKNTSYYSGDWENLHKQIFNDCDIKFDYIFTCETIYNPDNQEKLIKCIIDCLSSTGTAYIAAKSCYFGVGGSTLQFLHLLKETGKFTTEIVSCHDEGVKRDVIIAKYNKPA